MKIGCTFPHNELGTDPCAIRDFAQAAEQLGYHHIVIYDHVLGAVHADRDPPLTGPYTENDLFHEAMVTLGYIAGITSTIELVTGILILPQRQTVLVAKQAAQIDLLSNGRLRLGVGSGWNTVEYNGLNEDWDSRGARYQEQIPLLRQLWREPVLDFSGDYHRIDRAGLLPRPSRDIPIWMGGFHDRVLRRAARLADGMILSGGGKGSIESVHRLRDYVAAEGRDPDSFGVEAILEFQAGPDKWRQRLDAWQAVNASHMYLSTLGCGLMGADAQINALRDYAEAMGIRAD